MPNPNTFSIPPIRDFVMRHLRGVTVDPFAPRSGIWMNHQLWQILQQLRGREIEEILMVPHGGPHYDTICTASRLVNPRLI